jgi:hypothetical protein
VWILYLIGLLVLSYGLTQTGNAYTYWVLGAIWYLAICALVRLAILIVRARRRR